MVELRSDEASQSGPVRPATATSAVGVIRVLLTVLRSLPVFPVSGHSQSRSARLKGAKSRQMQCSKLRRQTVYSITSSARARSDGGTVRPSAFAVLMLITSSNLVGSQGKI